MSFSFTQTSKQTHTIWPLSKLLSAYIIMLRKKTKQVRNRNIQLSKMKNNLYVQMTHLSTEVTRIIKSPTKWNTYHIIVNNETIGINCHDMVKKKKSQPLSLDSRALL